MRSIFDSCFGSSIGSSLRGGLLCGAVTALALAAGQPAHAQYSLAAGGFIGAGLDYNLLGSGAGNSTGAGVTHTDTQMFTGMDSKGVTQTMTLSGTTFGAAEYGSLHASASAMLANPYYNANNPEYWDGTTRNPNGSPDAVEVQGSSGFRDTFTYTGFQGTGYKVRYLFHIDGSTGGDFINSALINFTAGSDPTDILQTSASVLDGSTADHQVNWGSPFTVSDAFYVTDVQYLDMNNPNYTEGQTLSGSADYSATAVLSGIQIVDSNGAQVNGWGFESASGTHYNLLGGQYGPAAVPEPGSAALLIGLVTVGAGFLTRRRRAVVSSPRA